MKTWCFLLPAVPSTVLLFYLANAVSGLVSSPVVINEVYYDHPGSDAGFEFVELYCTGETRVSLDGWSIAMIDGRTGEMRELWRAEPGTIIESGGLSLIGGDSCAVSPANHLIGSIENGPDAVVLLCDGEEIDLVCYGGDDPGCAPGRSLSRRPDGTDSGDTGTDFVCALPTPGLRNFHDCDLAVSFAGPLHVHCPSERADIPILLVNTGLDGFSGSAILTVLSEQTGFRTVAGSRHLSPALKSGEELAVQVSCPGLPAGISSLEIRLEADGDTNRSNDSGSVIVSSSPGEVVISEIMYRPVEGGEWIELFNRSPVTVDLAGWSVTDRSGASGSIRDGVEIEAGCFVVLAQDPDAVSAIFPACAGIVSALENRWPRLNDGDGDSIAEEIFVRLHDGTITESVSYRALIGEEKGRSIERLSPELCSAGSAGIWLRCGATGGATPGERNYCHTTSIPTAGMTVSPDPFCPELNGVVKFSAASRNGEVSYGARLFDMQGREIARLASGPIGAPAVFFVWDGRDSGGRPVITGLYICVVEFSGGGGGVCRREKRTVTVWAGQH